jgi:hypothetical protein
MNMQSDSTESSESHAKVSMIAIARYRFGVFRAKFHREPGPNDPIFFDEFKDRPIKADLVTARQQLAEAAHATKVRLDPVLRLLGLVPSAPVTGKRVATGVSRPAKSLRSQSRASRSKRNSVRSISAWDRFLADHRLHRRHQITHEELKILSRASFLGQIRSVEEFLFILKLIRNAED